VRTFQLVDELRTHHAVSLACSVPKVTPQGYYAWRKRLAQPGPRRQQDQQLYGPILALYMRSRETYGAPRIQRRLRHRETESAVAEAERKSAASGVPDWRRASHCASTRLRATLSPEVSRGRAGPSPAGALLPPGGPGETPRFNSAEVAQNRPWLSA
jgi:hypothetical protein